MPPLSPLLLSSSTSSPPLMPTYDFQCIACDHSFEQSIPFGSSNPACPSCSNAETRKCIAPPNIVFKGPGFYKTDSTPDTSQKASDEPSRQGNNTKEQNENNNKSTTVTNESPNSSSKNSERLASSPKES